MINIQPDPYSCLGLNSHGLRTLAWVSSHNAGNILEKKK